MRIPYIETVKSKGHTYYYYRRNGKRLCRLPGVPHSDEWWEAYREQHRKEEGPSERLLERPRGIPRRREPTGHRLPWPEHVIQQFRETCPVLEWLWAFETALYTGQRRSDLVKMKWEEYDGEFISVKQQKTGTEMFVYIHPYLQSVWNTIPKRSPYILTTPKTYSQWHVDQLTKYIKVHLRSLGYEQYVLHGLRHSAATRIAELGLGERAIQSVTGQKDPEMARLYSMMAEQKKLNKLSIAKLPTPEIAKLSAKPLYANGKLGVLGNSHKKTIAL